MKRILFLCTGNYYRSRFAEMLFNHLARARKLPWRAESKGLAVGVAGNIGPISGHAVEGLAYRGVACPPPWRPPCQARQEDLAEAELVVAVKEAEHRPLVEVLFPQFAARVEYWQIHDLDCSAPGPALDSLEEHVRALAERLALSGMDAAA